MSQWGQGIAPVAGSYAVGNTTSGVVPTDQTLGAYPIGSFGGAARGFLTQVLFSAGFISGNSWGGFFCFFDRLWHAGAFNFNDNITLSAQPSFSSRVPRGDFSGLQIWIEAVVNTWAGVPTFTINYTDQDGNTGHTTGPFQWIGPSGTTVPVQTQCLQVPLQAGDTGVQKIESVACSVSTAGTFNVIIARPLWRGFIIPWNVSSNASQTYNSDAKTEYRHWLDRTGMPELFANSCLWLMTIANNNAGSNTAFAYAQVEIASN